MKDIKKILIGLIAGIICGFFASGGGLILVPAFIYFLNMEDKKARGTSVFCILPMVVASSIFYYTENYIDWNIGIKCAIGGVIRRNSRSKIVKKNSNNLYKNIICCFSFIYWNKNVSLIQI